MLPSQSSWTTVTCHNKNKNKTQFSHPTTPATGLGGQAANPSQPPKPAKHSPNPAILHTEITVQRRTLEGQQAIIRSLQDPALITRQVSAALAAAKVPLTLLSGRWATYTNNFVYTFAGTVPFPRIFQVAHIL
jgi:hypothetical protein